jgi:hypothetical protein
MIAAMRNKYCAMALDENQLLRNFWNAYVSGNTTVVPHLKYKPMRSKFLFLFLFLFGIWQHACFCQQLAYSAAESHACNPLQKL